MALRARLVVGLVMVEGPLKARRFLPLGCAVRMNVSLQMLYGRHRIYAENFRLLISIVNIYKSSEENQLEELSSQVITDFMPEAQVEVLNQI